MLQVRDPALRSRCLAALQVPKVPLDLSRDRFHRPDRDELDAIHATLRRGVANHALGVSGLPVPPAAPRPGPRLAFSSLVLRKILEESHGQPARAMCNNAAAAAASGSDNLVATVCAAQAAVYEGANQGETLDILTALDLPEDAAERRPSVGCWIARDDDNLIAIGTPDGKIRFASFAQMSELAPVEEHQGAITELVVHPKNANMLLSCSEDKTSRLWVYRNLQWRCLAICHVLAFAAAFTPDGTSFYTGGLQLHEWKIPESDAECAPVELEGCLIKTTRTGGSSLIDQMAVTSDGRVAAKYSSGKIQVLAGLKVLWTLGLDGPGRFALHSDGLCNFLAVGDFSGKVHIYDLETYKRVALLSHERMSKPITSCSISAQTLSVICSDSRGQLYRWDYVPEEDVRNWRAEQKRQQRLALGILDPEGKEDVDDPAAADR